MLNQPNDDSGSLFSQTADTGELIPEDWAVPKVIRRRIGDQLGRQRAMAAEGHLLLILHAPPHADDLSRQGRVFWRDPEGHWRAAHHADGAKALSDHLLEFRVAAEVLDAREELAESADDLFSIVSEITPLHRTARNFHMAMQTAREIVDARDVINLRDESYNLERTTELLHQDAKNALEFLIARRAEQEAQAAFDMGLSAHRLNVLVAFFFPIATLCAVFGTNFKTGLEEMWYPYPFLLTLVAGLVMGFVLKVIVTRRPSRQP